MDKNAPEIVASRSLTREQDDNSKAHLPKELIVKCPRCRELLYIQDWKRNLKVCLHCQYHFRLSALERIAHLFDHGSFVESDAQMRSVDPIHFVSQSQSYRAKLREEEKRTGLREAVVIGLGCIQGYTLTVAIMDFRFIGGSMGSVVGEKITRAIELAEEKHTPLLIISASGGARMQEGIFSLMQMAKISVALARLSEACLPFISLLTDPTTGGVAASFAMLGDIILAEPDALIGFAGPRVIEQFLHQKLPLDTDTSEFMLANGMIDAIIPRHLLRPTVARLLQYYAPTLRDRCKDDIPLADRERKAPIFTHKEAHLYVKDNQQIRTLEVSRSPNEITGDYS